MLIYSKRVILLLLFISKCTSIKIKDPWPQLECSCVELLSVLHCNSKHQGMWS